MPEMDSTNMETKDAFSPENWLNVAYGDIIL